MLGVNVACNTTKASDDRPPAWLQTFLDRLAADDLSAATRCGSATTCCASSPALGTLGCSQPFGCVVDRPMISLRPARPDEAAFLTELCLRSKAVWGYDEKFIAACRPEVIMTPETVASSCVMVAEIDGAVVGMTQLTVRSSVAELDKLFIEPGSLRSGVGRTLLSWAKAEASRSGAVALMVDGSVQRLGGVGAGANDHPNRGRLGDRELG